MLLSVLSVKKMFTVSALLCCFMSVHMQLHISGGGLANPTSTSRSFFHSLDLPLRYKIFP